MGCPTALRSREEVQRITELSCCQPGPLQIVAISLINDNAIGHFHDAAFDALQLIARTRQLYQQEEVYHTVSTNILSKPAASQSTIVSRVLRATPPSEPAEGLGRIKDLG